MPGSQCNWFTFSISEQNCRFYSECVFEDPKDCLDCVTGEVTCQRQAPLCNEIGLCLGVDIESAFAKSKDECHLRCRNTMFCRWFTYNYADRDCHLSQDCSILDTGCQTCVSGEVTCQPLWTKLMLISGLPLESMYNDIEIIDLSNLTSTCTDPVGFPRVGYGSVGSVLLGTPIVCGGDDILEGSTNLCHLYRQSDNSWPNGISMTGSRFMPASVMINSSAWWVTGGHFSQADLSLSSTEVYTDNGGWSNSVSLPKAESGHCLLKLNDTHYFMVGGLLSGEQSFIFDSTSSRWIRLADLGEGRYAAACGLITTNTGEKEVVIAGGNSDTFNALSTTEVFSLSTLMWRPGPELPQPMAITYGVQYGDTFLAVGGINGTGGFYDTILEYNNTYGMGQWDVKKRMVSGRGVFPAFLVPDSAVNCV